ncbi:hypothetical protein [Micromonospora sp. WMMD736]|uniref:hypothetical protein n=1 Tax=Micromonospora sp. WMMD736 TaxID=3404112 RepID=UPI003B966BA2
MTAVERVDELVRDADPGRVLGDVGEVKRALLVEIMAESSFGRRAGVSRRWSGVRGVAGVVTAAAVLVSVLSVSMVVRGRSEGGGVSPIVTADAGVVYSPAVVAGAERNPRLLIDRAGWRVTNLSGFAEEQGGVTFRRGGQEVEMTWYPADAYALRYPDRRGEGPARSVRVDGGPAELFQGLNGDFTVMVRPRDGVYVEMRTSGVWSRKEVDRVLAAVVRVDVRTWLAMLPAEMVRPARERAAEVLVGVPLPPGFDVAVFDTVGVSDSYQFGVAVTSRVGCGWIEQWRRARAGGDQDAVRRAVEALAGSHGWRVLRDMDGAGDWPEVFWGVADAVVSGTLPAGYVAALGCR